MVFSQPAPNEAQEEEQPLYGELARQINGEAGPSGRSDGTIHELPAKRQKMLLYALNKTKLFQDPVHGTFR